MRNLILIFVLLLTGCDKLQSLMEGEAPSGKLVLEVNLSSPDNALKTWWRYLDAYAKSTHEFCLFETGRGNKQDMLDGITAGEVKVIRSGFGRCKEDVVGREILEVKQESDTRATALVRITNETPTTLVPTAEEAQQRKQGEMFKYLLEKDADGWKISQIYREMPPYAASQSSDPWIKLYKKYDESYPATVSGIFSHL